MSRGLPQIDSVYQRMKTAVIERNFPTLLDSEAVAKSKGFTPKTWRTWANEGRIDHLKIGRRILFLPHQVERFLETHVVSAKN